MDSKILYTNDNAELQCVAVKSIETVRNASAASRGGRPSSGAAAQRTPLSSSSDAVFLLPHESIYSYLYIGAADGTLLALRFQVFLKELAVPGNGLTYEHRVALEAQSKVVITAPNLSAVATRSRSSKARSRHGQESPSPSPTTTTPSATLDTEAAAAVDTAALRGVRAIYAPMELPYLFLLVHGCFQVHEDDTLQLLGLEYTASLGLVDATVLLLCAGEEQSAAARRRRRPTRSSDRRGVPSDGSVSSDATTAAYYALLLDSWAVVLVECTKTMATRLRFLDGAAEAAGWSDKDVEAAQHAALSSSSPPQSQSRPTPPRAHLADTLLPVQPHTCTMAWCGDALITGSPEYYRLYDTLYGTVLSQLDVSTLLGGCAPYTGYMRTAAVDPSRVGFELAAESAEVCSYSDGSLDRGSSSSSSSSSSGGDSSSSESDSSAGEGQLLGHRHAGGNCGTNAASMGWPSALVFRLRDGELHVCAGAGRADLTDAAPLVSAFGAVQEVHSCPPFLLCQRGGSDGGEDGGQSSRSSTSSRIRASLAELRRASQQLSAKLAESRRPAKQCEMILFSCLDGQPWTSPEMEPVTFMSVNLRGVQAFPLGLLGVSRHVVEALLWKPFAAQLEDQVETGHYARALRFVSQCFRGSEASRRAVLRQVCQASATRAMSRRRYRVAFYFYTLADTGVDSLLRLFPELQRPASTPTTTRRHSKDDSAPAAAASVVVAATASGALGAAKSGSRSRSRSRSRDASFAERHMRQFSYASPAPYRALYRILLSQFFSLVASAATVVDSPADDPAASSPSEPPSRCGSEAPVARGGSQSPTAATGASLAPRGDEPSTFPPSLPVTPPAQGAVTATRDTTTTGDTVFVPTSQPTTPAEAQTDATPSPSWPASYLSSATSACALAETSRAAVLHTRANIEFALFCLFAIDYAGARRLRTTRDELLQFMVSVRTLSRDDCASVVAALGLPPQSLLSALLLAATGNYDQALARCRDDGDVAAAGATLAMYARTPDATSAQLERLYQLQLPWMLEADPPTAVRLLTTPARFAGEKPGPAALLPVLLTVGGTVLLDYLSYLINTECCLEAVVHQLYATQLIHTLQTLREEWGLQGFASAELGAADGAGTETGLVGRVRRALLSFLQCSPLYDKERVLARLVEADLHEEQCVVLEALEDHIGVLTTLVYAMRDMDRAVRYCEAHYTQDRDHAHQSLPLADLLHRSASRSSTTTTTTAAAADRAPLLRTFEEGQEGGRMSNTAWTHDDAPPQFSIASTVHETFDRTVEGALDVVPLFPSRDCQRVASSEAAAMAHYTHEAVGKSAVAPSRVAAWHPIMRFNPYLHMLLHVLLIPPAGREVALSEIIWLLSTYSPYMSPRLVLLSLPGDVPLPLLAPYLIRAFQRLELNHQLVCMEAAAVQNAVSDAVRRHVTLQQRCVWVDDRRRCVVCGEPLEKGGLVVVFPNLKPAHFRCHQDGSLDPERAVPFLGNLA